MKTIKRIAQEHMLGGRHTQTYSWFEVIQTDDDARTVKVKTEFAKQVADAYQRFQDARQAYEKLIK